MNLLQKPLLEFLGLDGYLEPTTGKFIRLSSRSNSSDETKVNRQLSLIEGRNGQYAYLQNRVREVIASLILGQLLPGTSVYPSEIKNDILYHTDAIVVDSEKKTFAVDYTEDASLLDKKLQHLDSDGNGGLVGPDGRGVKLPFVVVYIARELIDSILGGILTDIEEGLPYIDITDNIRINISRMYEQDRLPNLLSTAHSCGHGDSVMLAQKIRDRTLLMGGIHLLGLSIRTRKLLLETSIHTIGHLCEKSLNDILMSSINLGNKAIDEIKLALANYNLSLKDNPIIRDLPLHEREIK